MAELSLHREAFVYASDDGTSYQITANAAEASQAATGGVVAAGTEPNYPEGNRPRKAAFRTSGLTPNVTREVTIFTAAAYAALTRASTVNLNHLGNSTAFKFTGKRTAERIKSRVVTTQIT